MHKKKSITPQSEQTISSLRRDISHSAVSRTKIKLTNLHGRLKRLYREYRLPSLVTAVFLIVLLSLGIIRQLEQTSLLALRNEITTDATGYSALLSDSEIIEFTRDDTTEDAGQDIASSNSSTFSNSTQSTSTPFVFSTDSTTTPTNTSTDSNSNSGASTQGGGSSDTPIPTTNPFTASIDSLVQGSPQIQCANPSKPNKGSCSKVYSFSADIRTVNGPGTVSYSWQSSTSTGNGSGSFTVQAGSTLTTVNKEVSLSCNKSASFTIQLALVSPSFSSSNTITIDHNCNEI